MTQQEREAVEKMITYVKEGTDLLIQQVNLIKVASPYYELYQEAITETLANMSESMDMVSDYLDLDKSVIEPQTPFEEQPVHEEKEEELVEPKGSDYDIDSKDSNYSLLYALLEAIRYANTLNKVDAIKEPTKEEQKKITKEEFENKLEIKTGKHIFHQDKELHNWRNAISVAYPCDFSYKGKKLGEVYFDLSVNSIKGFISIMMIDEDNNSSHLYLEKTEPTKNGYKPLSELYTAGQRQLLQTIKDVAWNRFQSSLK